MPNLLGNTRCALRQFRLAGLHRRRRPAWPCIGGTTAIFTLIDADAALLPVSDPARLSRG
jgi:hypothetical protein